MIKSFLPIVSQKPYVLILGTMPGIESIKQQEYYAHSRNLFWKILFETFQVPFSINYDDRKALILNNHLALWDTLKYCNREGSLDSNIKNEIPNEINAFLKNHPTIEKVVFNGQGAMKYFHKYFKQHIPDQIDLITMPSTSPANASINYAAKIESWGLLPYLCRQDCKKC